MAAALAEPDASRPWTARIKRPSVAGLQVVRFDASFRLLNAAPPP